MRGQATIASTARTLAMRIHNRRGTTLPELVAIITIASLLAVLLLVMGDRSRRLAMLSEDLNKLKTISHLNSQYANDFSNKVATFSWKAGDKLSKYPDLNNASTDLQAAANQAVDILRRLGNREDIPIIQAWVPHFLAGNLVLAEYAELTLPSRLFISSADANRLLWASDPLDGFDKNKFGANQPPPNAANKRWPYTGSFTPVIASWSFPWSGASAIVNGSTHSTFITPSDTQCGGRSFAEMVHPSQKVLAHDLIGRHHGRAAFFGYKEARVPAILADGSVQVLTTANTNRGWSPLMPTSPLPIQYTYSPQSWEPPSLAGVSTSVEGHYRYTRQGLSGRDIGGPEVP